MSKYDALGAYLSKQPGAEILMTFAEIEAVIGMELPPKAQHQPAWWSNNASNNVMTKVWIDAGFKTEQVNIAARKLVFKRQPEGYGGFGEASHPISAPIKKPGRHPLIGCMAGTFSIEPGFDLAGPASDADELAGMDANLDRTADLVEQGGAKKQ